MAFDPHNKSNFPLLNYMKEKRALIADNSSNSRPVLRRLLAQLGMKNQNVDIAESFEEAEKKMRGMRPHFIFADYGLGDKTHTGLDLLASLREQFPGHLESAFFISSEKRSNLITAQIIEQDVDAFLPKPYSYSSLEDLVVKVLREKLTPSEYVQCIDTGRIHLQGREFKEALQNFQRARGLDPRPALACYFLAITLNQLKKVDLARSTFEEAVKLDPSSYRTLTSYFDFLMEQKSFPRAYEIGSQIWKSFPILPARFPQYLRVTIQTGHFGDVLGFYETLSADDSLDEINANFLAVGLVTAGKYFIKQGDQPQGATLLKKSLIIGKGKLKIFKEVVSVFLENGLEQEALELLSNAPKEVKESREVSLLEFEHVNRTSSADKVIQMGMNLIGQGIHEVRIYEILIRRSIEMSRRADAIEELIHRATQQFPEQRAFFEGLNKTATP